MLWVFQTKDTLYILGREESRPVSPRNRTPAFPPKPNPNPILHVGASSLLPPALELNVLAFTSLLNIGTPRSSTQPPCFQFAVAVAASHRDIFLSLGLTGSHLSRSRKLIAGAITPSAKIPDIEKCLDVVVTLQAKKGTGEPLIADFEVSEGIYSRASIEDADSVCLWLGANVMLEYSCEEAGALLQKNLENAKANLEVLVADLQFLRD